MFLHSRFNNNVIKLGDYFSFRGFRGSNLSKKHGISNVLTLHPDMTFTETKEKTEHDKIIEIKGKISKETSLVASFKMGVSLFKERKTWSSLKFWKHQRHLLIRLDGATKCFYLEPPKDKDAESQLLGGYWTESEAKKLIAKLVAKSKADQKSMSRWEFVFLALISILNLVVVFLIAKGMGII